MNPKQAAAFLPIIQALADGKPVQCRSRSDDTLPWIDVNEVGNGFAAIFAGGWQFRVKPEPTLRAWKLREVPVGALIRSKASNGKPGWPRLILSVDRLCDDEDDEEDGDDVVVYIQSTHTRRIPVATLRDGYEWKHATSDAAEAMWFPCGVQQP